MTIEGNAKLPSDRVKTKRGVQKLAQDHSNILAAQEMLQPQSWKSPNSPCERSGRKDPRAVGKPVRHSQKKIAGRLLWVETKYRTMSRVPMRDSLRHDYGPSWC